MDDEAAIEETLRGYYTALLRDQDFAAARRHTSPRFALRPGLYIGGNIDAADQASLNVRRGHERERSATRTCEEWVRRHHASASGMYPFRGWAVESIEISEEGTTAHAVTQDGSAGLEKLDGRWLMLWAFGPP